MWSCSESWIRLPGLQPLDEAHLGSNTCAASLGSAPYAVCPTCWGKTRGVEEWVWHKFLRLDLPKRRWGGHAVWQLHRHNALMQATQRIHNITIRYHRYPPRIQQFGEWNTSLMRRYTHARAYPKICALHPSPKYPALDVEYCRIESSSWILFRFFPPEIYSLECCRWQWVALCWIILASISWSTSLQRCNCMQLLES